MRLVRRPARRPVPGIRRARTGRSAAVSAVAALVAVTAVACSSSTWDTSEIDRTTTTEEVEYSRDEAGITASLVDHLVVRPVNLNEWSPSESQARCVADRLLRRFSPDHLFEIGFEPADGALALGYTPEERSSVVNIVVGCIDYPAAVLEMLSAYDKVPLRVAACVSRGVERLGLDRRLAEGLVDGAEPDPFAGDGELATGIANLSVECTLAEDLQPNGVLPVMPRSDISDGVDGRSDSSADELAPDDGTIDPTTDGGADDGSGLDLGGGSDGTGGVDDN